MPGGQADDEQLSSSDSKIGHYVIGGVTVLLVLLHFFVVRRCRSSSTAEKNGTPFAQELPAVSGKAQQEEQSEALCLATSAADMALYARLAARQGSRSTLKSAVHEIDAAKRLSDVTSLHFRSTSPRRVRPRSPEKPPRSSSPRHAAAPPSTLPPQRSTRPRPVSPPILSGGGTRRLSPRVRPVSPPVASSNSVYVTGIAHTSSQARGSLQG